MTKSQLRQILLLLPVSRFRKVSESPERAYQFTFTSNHFLIYVTRKGKDYFEIEAYETKLGDCPEIKAIKGGSIDRAVSLFFKEKRKLEVDFVRKLNESNPYNCKANGDR